ncbi:MAG: PAS domain-containing protein [Chloroflexales bacterium]|nr:PAS domain-containing protein [Chloroflexales bacterium]
MKTLKDLTQSCESGEHKVNALAAPERSETNHLATTNSVLPAGSVETPLNGKHTHTLLEAIPDLLLLIQRDGVILDYKPSKAIASLMPNRNVQGEHFFAVLPVALAQQILSALEQVLQTGVPQVYDYALPQRLGNYLLQADLITRDQLKAALNEQRRLRAKRENVLLGDLLVRMGQLSADDLENILKQQQINGDLRFIETRILRSGPNEILAIMRDITERKQAEAALYYQSRLLDSISDAVIAVDNSCTIQSWNRAAQSIYGWNASDVIGKKLHDIGLTMFPGNGDKTVSMDRQLEDGHWQGTTVQRDRHGRNVDVLMSASLVKNALGHPIGLVALHRDITEQKQDRHLVSDIDIQATETPGDLHRSYELLRALFDGLNDGLMLLDHTGVVLGINPALAALLGVTPMEAVGMPWAALCGKPLHPFPGQKIVEALQNRAEIQYREGYTDPAGQRHVLDIRTILMTGPEQRVDYAIVHVVDGTERLVMDAIAIQHERFAASGKLAETVAHEVNTPLQAIQHCLYLAEKLDGEERTIYLSLAREEIGRVSDIVNRICNLYRPSQKTPTSINMHALIDRVILLMQRVLAQQEVILEQNFASTMPFVRGRVDHLTQVLLHLMMNAVESMPEGGLLRLDTTIEQHRIPTFAITINDTGEGIRPEVQARVFDPFFTTKSGRSGIGLAICRYILQQHNGSIAFASTPGQGSTFTVLLPIG